VAVTSDGHLFAWNLRMGLRLRDRALMDAVRHAVLPGSLTKLSDEELKAAPVLNPQRDGDAYGGRSH